MTFIMAFRLMLYSVLGDYKLVNCCQHTYRQTELALGEKPLPESHWHIVMILLCLEENLISRSAKQIT